MARKTSGQKYNFLVALLRQVEEASDEGDEAYAEWRRRIDEDLDFEQRLCEYADRIAKLEQWSAQLELALAELEQASGESVGEDALDDDDGDYNDDVEGMAVEMVSARPPVRRDTGPVGGGSPREAGRMTRDELEAELARLRSRRGTGKVPLARVKVEE